MGMDNRRAHCQERWEIQVMKKSFKTGTIKTTPSKINGWEYNGVGLEVSRFIGISTLHSIFLNYDDMGYTYLVSPGRGRLRGRLKKWVKKEQTFLTWTPKSAKKFPLGQMEAWKAATDHAMEKAFYEVARESDLDLNQEFWTGVPTVPFDEEGHQRRLASLRVTAKARETFIDGAAERVVNRISNRAFSDKILDELGPRQWKLVCGLDTIIRDRYFDLRRTMDHAAAYKKVVADDLAENGDDKGR